MQKVTNVYFQYENSMKRSYFSGKMTPTPVITTRGLCFALKARNMKQVFSSSEYLDSFEHVFENNASDELINGHQHSIELDVDMQSKYLTDRASNPGNFWYGPKHIIFKKIIIYTSS